MQINFMNFTEGEAMQIHKTSLEQMQEALASTPSAQLKKALEMSPIEQLKKALADTQGPLISMSKTEAQELLSSLQSWGKTPFEMAMETLKKNAVTMPFGFEFEIPQVIGTDIWSQLDRGSKLALGKHVKASQDAYGVQFLRTSTSNHAIYRRAE
jgi:hypothetical protein